MLKKILNSRKFRDLAIKILFFKLRLSSSSKTKKTLTAYKNIIRLSLNGCPFYLLMQRMQALDLLDNRKGLLSLPGKNQQYLLIKVPELSSLTNKEKLMDQRFLPIIEAALKQDVNIIFDLSGEAICFDQCVNEDTAAELLAFYKILAASGYPSKRVYLLSANIHAFHYFQDFAAKHNLNYQLNYLGYNFYLFYHYIEASRKGFIEPKSQTQLIECAKKNVITGEKRRKYFMCLNLKTRTHRIVLVTFLLQRGYLEKGIVTYFGAQTPGQDTLQLSAKGKTYLKHFSDAELIADTYDQLERMAPLTYERKAEEVEKLFYKSRETIGRLIPEVEYHGSLKQIDTYFEIITETYFSNQKCLYLTEKTLRALFRFQFFIVVGCPYSLKYLREAGFQTFSPYINESYDEIEDEIERFTAILKEIDRLCRMSLDELHELYCQLWPRIEHNFKHFCSRMPELFRREASAMLSLLD